MNYIRLKDVLTQMDRLDESGRPVQFNIKFVTHDEKRGTGGEIIEVDNARKCVGKRGGKVVFDARENVVSGESSSRNPNHWLNSTRNILLPNGEIRKIHIRLIIEFNNQKVCF